MYKMHVSVKLIGWNLL